MAKGVSLKKEDHENLEICVLYIEEKQHKVNNRHMLAERMAKRLEIVYSNTCGTFRMPSKAGA